MTFDTPQLFKVCVEEFFNRELLDVILVVSNDNVKAEEKAKEMYLENNEVDQIECSAYLIKQVDGYNITLTKDDKNP